MRSSISEVADLDPAGSATQWSFARRPKWMLSHLGVLLLVGAMITAGLWQIGRHNERADQNDIIRARAEIAVVDVADVATPSDDDAVGDDQQFRRVRAEGTFVVADQVTIRNRSFDGSPGVWVVTPLLLDEGWAVAVNRGWVPANLDLGDVPPPSGRVEVVGFVQPTRRPEGLQQPDPAEGRLSSLARIDLERLGAQLDYRLAPVVLQAASPGFAPRAETADLPFVLDLPALDAGPHASYAAQWFIFTTIALIGYPLILRRVAHGRGRSLTEQIPSGDPDPAASIAG